MGELDTGQRLAAPHHGSRRGPGPGSAAWLAPVGCPTLAHRPVTWSHVLAGSFAEAVPRASAAWAHRPTGSWVMAVYLP